MLLFSALQLKLQAVLLHKYATETHVSNRRCKYPRCSVVLFNIVSYSTKTNFQAFNAIKGN